MNTLRQALEIAMDRVGGGAELARRIVKSGKRQKLARQAIYQWDRVPPDLVLTVEDITGISRTILRPDLYPPSAEAPPTAPEAPSDREPARS